MPKESEKCKLLKGLCLQNIFDLIDVDLDKENEEDIILDFTVHAAIVLHNRRGTHFGLPKSVYWTENVLNNLDEGRLRQMLRVNKKEFNHILALIENDPVFHTKSVTPQMPIHMQLKIALFRFGSNGDSGSIRKIASLFGVGDGGTIIIATKRVIHALLNLKPKYLFWPSAERRKKLVDHTMHELPGCVGYVDGTEIRLAASPIHNHQLYYSRKKQYSIKVQVVCDHFLRIRHAVIGHYGSVHDARIFNESCIGQAPERFLCEKQYIAGDSAYPLSQYIVTPFRQNSSEHTEEQRVKFNNHFSKFRVRIENCFGKLKQVWSSLNELRFRLHDEENHKLCCNWIMACCILHNILIEMNITEDDDVGSHLEYLQEMHSTNNIRAALVVFINNNF